MLDFGFYKMDCMEGMKQFPDKYFDLAIVDPPYGINYDALCDKSAGTQSKNGAAPKRTYHTADWDNKRPNKAYFDELRRVSRSQIIWGGNYFADMLEPSRSFVVWDKRYEGIVRSFADCEYAWMSPSLGVARMFRYVWDGMIQGDMANKEHRIHPTQKPVALYKWLLTNYAKESYKILDTHVGSASSLIACHQMGFDYVGFEIDEEYYKLATKRLDTHKSQVSIMELIDDWRLP